MTFSAKVLELDAPREIERITTSIRETVATTLKRRGVVLGLSGGIDSSVCAALAVRALGKDRVFGLHMPEGESSDESQTLSERFATGLGIDSAVEDITEVLRGAGCYRRRDEAIRLVIPEYGDGWKSKLVLPSVVNTDSYQIFSIVAQSPSGEMKKVRLTPKAYLGIVAASNFKQRARKMMEYYHADRLNYAVLGTPNRLEYDQGFFVKNGDGAADLKPIAHLYKSQVYALAAHLDIPDEIRRRPPTTDTYSLAQTQEEFYFSLPYDRMDLCLWAKNHGVAPAEVARATGLTDEQVERVFRDVDSKRKTTRYQHLEPILVDEVGEISQPPQASER